ncbi:hypothetical protein [Herbidospora mongoliensis]|uniref:hypothetical protein n=1 Tax=Herbidospora mongoliensis TaxID=688067 RepID=UPI0008368957|nr:hypothetical protein [Herbidospora mongoliensis]
MTAITHAAVLSDPSLADTIGELRDLARNPRLARRRDQLTQLADDLDTGTDLRRWAGVGLFSAFLRDDTVTPAPRSTAGAVFDLLPGVLIFFPIGITWWGLKDATAAYRESRGDVSLAGKSFLEQWQTGFNGRLSATWHFDRIALYTLIALGVLLTISVVQALFRWRRDRKAAVEQSELLSRLAAALTTVELRLADYRVTDQSRLATGVEGLIEASKDVQATVDAVRVMQIEAHETLLAARRSIETLREGTVRVEEAARQVGVGADDLAAAADVVAASSSELARSVSAGERALTTSVGGSLDRAGEAISTALTEWRTEGALYSHHNERSSDQLGIVAAVLQSLQSSLDRIPDSVHRLDGQSAATAHRLEQVVAEAVGALRAEIARNAAGQPGLDVRVATMVAELTALRASVDVLASRLDRRWPWQRRP